MRTLIALLILLPALAGAQTKMFTKKGKVSFYSETSVEKIEAHNNRVTAVLEKESGRIEFSMLITAFEFEKALMQEHFNENYMESAKFPKSIFKGTITNIKDVDFTKDGEYAVKVEGDLTIHGVTKKVAETGKIIIKSGKVSASSSFNVALKDYNITVPSVVGAKIAEVIKVSVFIATFELIKK